MRSTTPVSRGLAVGAALALAFTLLVPDTADARKRRKKKRRRAQVTKVKKDKVKAETKAPAKAAPARPEAADKAADPASGDKPAAGTDAAPPAAKPAAPTGPGATVPVSTLPFVKGDAKKVFLFLDPIAGPDKKGIGELGGVFTRLAVTRLNSLEAVRLKTWREMPDVSPVLARYGDLGKLDRVSLITIKNVTGFDGLVRVSYAYEGTAIALTMTLFDFRNGQVFRKRTLKQPLDATLFATLQSDLVEFATTVRRSYRVTLRIESSPTGAQVLLNRRPIGTTPLVAEVKAGNHKVRILKKGFRDYERTFQLSDGDRLNITATLYNPLAARFLNAPPGFRVDSRQLELGYRYMWLNMERPDVSAGHFFELSWLLRFLNLDVGLRYAASGMSAENPLDTFLGAGQGVQRYDIGVYQFHALTRIPIAEKYSFASVALAGSAGLTWASSNDSERELGGWSPSGMLGVELVSRLVRSGNFSLEARMDLGIAAAGTLPYTERTFSLFGAGKVEEKEKIMWGPTASLALRLVFWNDIF